MTQHATTARRAISAAALLAAGLALAGCKSSASASGTASSPATGSGTPASSSSPAGTGGAASAGTAYFPVAVGNTWVYETSVAGTSHGTITNKITKVTPVSGGQRVTMEVINGTAAPTYGTYIFNSDGSIAIPFTQVGATTIKVTSGSIIWPSASELASGQPHKSTLVFETTLAGSALHETADVTVQGRGSQNVTVPAGSYDAQLIDETIGAKFDGATVTLALETWVANGVGPVKSELVTKDGPASLPGTVEELKSFTKG